MTDATGRSTRFGRARSSRTTPSQADCSAYPSSASRMSRSTPSMDSVGVEVERLDERRRPVGNGPSLGRREGSVKHRPVIRIDAAVGVDIAQERGLPGLVPHVEVRDLQVHPGCSVVLKEDADRVDVATEVHEGVDVHEDARPEGPDDRHAGSGQRIGRGDGRHLAAVIGGAGPPIGAVAIAAIPGAQPPGQHHVLPEAEHLLVRERQRGAAAPPARLSRRIPLERGGPPPRWHRRPRCTSRPDPSPSGP